LRHRFRALVTQSYCIAPPVTRRSYVAVPRRSSAAVAPVTCTTVPPQFRILHYASPFTQSPLRPQFRAAVPHLVHFLITRLIPLSSATSYAPWFRAAVHATVCVRSYAPVTHPVRTTSYAPQLRAWFRT
jgi:hypothetical protein